MTTEYMLTCLDKCGVLGNLVLATLQFAELLGFDLYTYDDRREWQNSLQSPAKTFASEMCTRTKVQHTLMTLFLY